MWSILSYFLLLPVMVSTWGEDAGKMEKKYLESDFSLEYNIRYYNFRNDPTFHLEEKGIVKKSDKGYLTCYEGKVLLSNPQCYVIIDNDGKQIRVFPPFQKQQEALEQSNPFTWRNTQGIKKVVKIRESNTQRTYQIYSHGEVYKYEVCIGLPDYELQKLVYYYDTKNSAFSYEKVEISYYNIDFSPHFSSNDFSNEKYFLIKNNKVTTQPKYKDYSVFNQLNTQ